MMNYIKRTFTNMALKTGVLISCMLLSFCDDGFEEMNVDPNAYNDPVIGNLFTFSIIRTAGTGTMDRNRVGIKHVSGMMQYMATLNTFWYGEKYLYHDQGGNFFENAYNNQLKELQQIFPEVQDDPELINQYAMARIWRVFVMHRITDLYGDIPYSEAGQGYTQGIFKPTYDQQSAIYADMLKELEEAAGQLDPAKSSFGAADLIYGGDLEKWKTFAYSMMLRLGMRLTEVDPGMAQSWVEKAIAGGVMQSNEDIAKLEHVEGHGNTQNWDAFELKRESLPEGAQGKGKVKLAKNFVDLLQANNDPRLPFYATLWEGNILAIQAAVLPETTKPELQKGLPNGYDDATISQAISGWSNDLLVEYSEPNTGTIANLNAPTIFQSYEEVEFLLAEAALRGWGGGSAQEHYTNAITASMESTTLFPGGIVIEPAVIEAYLASHPLTGTTEEQMETIHTQFYLAHFMWLDFFEAWSNWRRTGYPELTPVNYPGNDTGGVIPRRLRYPQSEAALNTENYQGAIQNQGPDLLLTRIWWDAE
uniref:SusD/RagB family nutrient-binding outer membrane lipoprotein n=1 Tax=Roseihalotalea indica TaxID=2867963 RepID=A0AA49GR89_9BACT|nr:SusD/RagB family nutrient-binding outer membrane lipoprotein [Tunicatimonas sp. TK19036]